jgi:coenzyme F420 hydrogenase subunit beta
MNYARNASEVSVQKSDETLNLKTGSLYQAKSVERIPHAQDGGVVSSLLGYALDEGIIKGAVVVGKDVHWNTYPVLVTDSRDLKKYAGSVYFPINNKEHRMMVRRAIDTYGDIGIVVTPGEMSVLGSGTNMIRPNEVYLKIGLFCLGSFRPDEFWNYVDGDIKREDIKRFEIDANVRLLDEGGKTVFQRPVKEAHDHSTSWCKRCRYFIPSTVDLSIGAGPKKGTSAVYLQTARGLEIFRKAHENGRLSVEDVPPKFKERFEKTMHQKQGDVQA